MEDLKQEAIRRMKILRLDTKIIKDYVEKNLIYVSEIRGEYEIANQEQLQLLQKLEVQNNIKIYHIIHLVSKNRNILYFLFITQKRKKWIQERKDISLGYLETIAVKNTRDLEIIGFKTKNGKVSVVI